ncbi:MAG: carbohydrate kinase family protein [Anaerolineae bacterium]|nr:carbohydrate kinase family protein [Anaerolineae bacterium]
MEPTPHVVVMGAASIDIKGRALEPLLPLTSNPGAIQLGLGGCARNVAENLARLGISTTLVSVVGSDLFGQAILSHTADAGVDVSPVIVSPDYHTGAYLTLLEAEGQTLVCLDDMSALEMLTPELVASQDDLFYGADMIIVDANLPQPTLECVAQLARSEGIPLCVDPTSVILAPKLTHLLNQIDLFVPNMAEAEVYCGCDVGDREQAIGVARTLVKRGVGTAIVTLGAEGVAFATFDESGWIPAFPIDDIVDPTGVGAALTAGVIFGLLNQVPLDEAVRLGASAAALTLQSPETVRSDLNLDMLYDKIMVF